MALTTGLGNRQFRVYASGGSRRFYTSWARFGLHGECCDYLSWMRLADRCHRWHFVGYWQGSRVAIGHGYDAVSIKWRVRPGRPTTIGMLESHVHGRKSVETETLLRMDGWADNGEKLGLGAADSTLTTKLTKNDERKGVSNCIPQLRDIMRRKEM